MDWLLINPLLLQGRNPIPLQCQFSLASALNAYDTKDFFFFAICVLAVFLAIRRDESHCL